MRGRRSARRDPGHLVFGTIGWLFADLMVALAMAFLVATTVGQPPPPEPRPTPSPTPTPTVEPALDLRPVHVEVKVDWRGLLADRARARSALRRKIHAVQALKGRRAGLVLAFGGGAGTDVGRAMLIARKANAVLRELGSRDAVFRRTVFRPFISFSDAKMLSLDIYMFKLRPGAH